MQKTTRALLKLIKKSGAIIRSAHGVNDGITEKSGSANFVTEYDVRVQSFLIDGIKKIFPCAYFVAEEKENDTAALNEEFCFVIDPIDGTTNFIHNLQMSAISVGMLCRGVPVLGIIYNPFLDEIYYAEKGNGAFCNEKQIHVSDRVGDNAVVVFGTSPYNKDTDANPTFDIAKEVFAVTGDLRRTGSAAIDLALIAAGRADLFFETVLRPWDYAAGLVLVKEAGGIITDMQGNELPLDRSSSVIAGNPNAFPTMLNITKNYC